VEETVVNREKHRHATRRTPLHCLESNFHIVCRFVCMHRLVWYM